MRPLRALVIYIVVVFIGGALLAPWLYRLAQLFASAFPHLAGMPFHRYLDRSFMILALLGLWPLLRALGTGSWQDIGIVPPYGNGKRFWGGALLGSFSLALVAGLTVGFGGRTLAQNLTAYKLVGGIFSAIVTAVAVGILEEILYRGGLFGGLRRVLYWPFALAISSAIYAITHFFQRAELAGPVAWHSGLVLLPRMLSGFVDYHMLVPGFFTLTLVGVMLGLAYQRTGNLYFSIGLHAGWVFWIKLFGLLTIPAAQASTWFWGTGKLYDGWLIFLVLLATWGLLQFLPLAERRPHYSISP